jgi:ACR3 family arsenite efflux pump ArsB
VRVLTAPLRAGAITALLVGAILAGSLLGAFAPATGQHIARFADPLILLLVGSLFFTLRLGGLAALRRAPRAVLLALGMNFLAIPVVAYALTALLPSEALRLGALLYCLAPCTDWFLGFTRLAGGDTTIGAALIPVQMTLQLLLYPLWLGLFAHGRGDGVLAAGATAVPTLLTWFALPAVLGLGMRLLMRLVLPMTVRAGIVGAVDRAVPGIIAAVIVAIFAGNIGTILADPGAFAGVLGVVFLFFAVVFVLGEGVSRLFRLRSPEHALLTMTTSARNAPLMLAVTMVALPDQPIVHAAIVLGMLAEFPHLTVVTQLLRHRAARSLPISVAEPAITP